MISDLWFVMPILIVAAAVSVLLRKVTITGAIVGVAIGIFIFYGAGYTGIAMLALFFILGSAATAWKMNVKETLGAAEKNKGRRTAGQVIANAGVAGIAGLLSVLLPQHISFFRLVIAASLSSAAADTLSSELGTLYGKEFRNIITFKKDKRGLDGVVSVEGTLFGVAASALFALIFALGFGWSIHVLWILISGTLGNAADSVLGAIAERKGYLTNDQVNFLNTLIAVIMILVLVLYIT